MRRTGFRVFFRHVLLTVLALASMALSWLIWTNPARYERSHQQVTSSEKVQSDQATREMSDVVTPTQVVYSNGEQKQSTIGNTKIDLSHMIASKVGTWKMKNVRLVVKGNKERYLDYATAAKSVLLKYENNITGNIFNETFNQSLKMSDQFGRILIPLDRGGQIYLLNDKNYNVYQIDVTNQDLNSIESLVEKANIRNNVKEEILNHSLITMYQDTVEAPYYSYQLNKLNSNLFVSNLLSAADSGSTNSKKTKEGTVYTDGRNSKRLVIRDNGTVQFNDSTRGTNASNDLRTRIENSFSQLRELGVPLDNMRYFNYISTDNQIVFRSFVEGYPIFNKDDLGTVKVTGNNNDRQTDFSIYSLEIPMPAQKKSVSLPDSRTTLDQLQASGFDMDEVDGIQIGYTWEGNVKTDSNVNLVPSWYVHYKNKWVVVQNSNN